MKLFAYAAVLGLAAATAACSAGPDQYSYGYGPGYVSTGTYAYAPGYQSMSSNPAINSPVQARVYSASPS